MYGFTIKSGYAKKGVWHTEQKVLETYYGFNTRDEARDAAIKRCLALNSDKGLPVYQIFVR